MDRKLSEKVSRLIGRCRENGYQETLSHYFRALRKYVKNNPNLDFYFLNPKRVSTALFERHFTRVAPDECERLGGYLMDAARLSSDSVVYSVGVATNTEFDEEVAGRFGCTVHLFDPTPLAIEYMVSLSRDRRKNLVFSPIGVWTSSGTVKFYYMGKSNTPSANMSIVNLDGSSDFFEGEVKTIDAIMRELGHNHIDVLKMDIEGAAIEVLNDALDKQVFPTQIAVEFERPRPWSGTLRFFRELGNLLRRLERLDYVVYRMPRDRKKFHSLDVLAIRGPRAGADDDPTLV